MTDDDDLEALLARQADEVRQFVERTRASDAQGLLSLARQLSEAMDLGMAEVVAAVRQLGLSGTAVNVSEASANLGGRGSLTAGGTVSAVANLTAVATITANGGLDLSALRFAGLGEVDRADDNLAVVGQNDIVKLAEMVTRDRSAEGLSITQVLSLVLVWLLVCITISLTQQLPGDPQSKLTNDLAEVAIGITMTLAFLRKRKR